MLTLHLAAQRVSERHTPSDWMQFGAGPASSGSFPSDTGITSANVASLVRRQVQLDGTVDASAIYLHAATVNGTPHDTFFVTTTYGKTIAIDAAAGTVLWEYTPPGYSSWAGSAQITTSAPAADPDRQYLYAAAPDGTVTKLAVADGHVVWTTAITLLPSREKIASPIKQFAGRIIAVTGGYVGDAPSYQGHVAVLDSQTGALEHVWNSLCSDRAGLIPPTSCGSSGSAIWGRSGAVIDPVTGNLFVATGNGPYNGKTDWGDSLIELSPDASRMLGNYSPSDNSFLEGQDLDLGSTSPVLLPGAVAQGGKDALIRLVGTAAIAGSSPRTGSELQTVSTPGKTDLFSSPALWQSRSGAWMFVANAGGTAAFTVGAGQLSALWSNSTAGTSPVVANRLLYVYNPGGGLYVYDPLSGKQMTRLDCGSGHWNSPIVVDGRIALPEGNSNQHAASGVLNIWTLPQSR